MVSYLAQIYKANCEGITRAVYDLADRLTKNPEDPDLVLDLFHRDLQTAIHCSSEKVWKRAKWK
jgi:hypothetical protein